MKKILIFTASVLFSLAALYAQQTFKPVKTDAEWKQQLSPAAYSFTRKDGTEQSYTAAYWDNHEAGTYKDFCCGLD